MIAHIVRCNEKNKDQLFTIEQHGKLRHHPLTYPLSDCWGQFRVLRLTVRVLSSADLAEVLLQCRAEHPAVVLSTMSSVSIDDP